MFKRLKRGGSGVEFTNSKVFLKVFHIFSVTVILQSSEILFLSISKISVILQYFNILQYYSSRCFYVRYFVTKWEIRIKIRKPVEFFFLQAEVEINGSLMHFFLCIKISKKDNLKLNSRSRVSFKYGQLERFSQELKLNLKPTQIWNQGNMTKTQRGTKTQMST